MKKRFGASSTIAKKTAEEKQPTIVNLVLQLAIIASI